MAFTSGGAKDTRPLVAVSATPLTLTAADSGKIFQIKVADCVVNLPATEDGLDYTFVVTTVSATTGCSISPVAADSINEGTDNKDYINTAATDAVGDAIRVRGNGGTGWLTTEMHGIWAAEA